MPKQYQSHGAGSFDVGQFKSIGSNVIFEKNVLVFHPENIELSSNIYIGHNSILKAYYKNVLTIGENTWIGQNCFFHSAGGIKIGKNVGIGPNVQILTSIHSEQGREVPILFSDLVFKEVVIEDDSDIGVGTIILPGVRIGKGAQVGAGSIVTKDVEDYAIVAGNPAKVLRHR